jgi:hypothetical protein
MQAQREQPEATYSCDHEGRRSDDQPKPLPAIHHRRRSVNRRSVGGDSTDWRSFVTPSNGNPPTHPHQSITHCCYGQGAANYDDRRRDCERSVSGCARQPEYSIGRESSETCRNAGDHADADPARPAVEEFVLKI